MFLSFQSFQESSQTTRLYWGPRIRSLLQQLVDHCSCRQPLISYTVPNKGVLLVSATVSLLSGRPELAYCEGYFFHWI